MPCDFSDLVSNNYSLPADGSVLFVTTTRDCQSVRRVDQKVVRRKLRCLKARLFQVGRRLSLTKRAKWVSNGRRNGAKCRGRRRRLLVASISAFQLRACNKVQTFWDAFHYPVN